MARCRSVGDPLCDNALLAVFQCSSSSVGNAIFASSEHYVAANLGDGLTHAFLRQVSQRLPTGIQVTTLGAELAQELLTASS